VRWLLLKLVKVAVVVLVTLLAGAWRIPSEVVGHAAMLKVLVVLLQSSRVPRLVTAWNEGDPLRVGCILKLEALRVDVEVAVAVILVAVSHVADGARAAAAAAEPNPEAA